MKYPQVSDDPAVQRRYVACRKAGSSHRVAEMLALRQGPALNTDTRFLSGHVNGSQFAGGERTEAMGSHYRTIARQNGVSTEGAVYKGQLARFPGDPKAWVRSKADCIARARELGMSLEGSVNYKAPPVVEKEPDNKPYTVAEDLVENAFVDLCEKEPSLAEESRRNKAAGAKVKDQLRETLSGRG